MMVCRTQNSGYAIHPCVEINLRMNMGVVARLIYDNYVCDGVQGRYVIDIMQSLVRHGILILRFKKSILYIWRMEK